MAFATSDIHSHSMGSQGLLSVEYLHYYSVQQMPKPDPEAGVSLKEVSHALLNSGQPAEADWPYSDPAVNPWAPPKNISTVWQAKLDYMAGKVLQLEALIKQEKPIVINVELTKAFFLVNKESPIVSFDVEVGFGLHSVVVVGLAQEANKKLFLVRNSWGSGWGDGGHAWLHAAYLDRHMHSIAQVSHNLTKVSSAS